MPRGPARASAAAVQAPIRIGARGSRLSRTQAGHMQAAIAAALGAPPEAAEEVAPLVFITTTGDRIQDRRLLELGGKALFTKEIEEALLDGRVDCAVHSMKDVPADMPDGLALAAVPAREDARDAFVSRRYAALDALPQGAKLGTASLRRQAQALRRRPDLQVVLFRGNVDTRLRKLNEGEVDATLLAAAGLNRMGLSAVIRDWLDPVAAPPAPGQGALAIQARTEDAAAPWLTALHHADTALCVAAERGALEALEGNCRTAIGAHARLDGSGALTLTVEALSPGGTDAWRREASTTDATEPHAHALGFRLGAEIAAEAGDAIRLGA